MRFAIRLVKYWISSPQSHENMSKAHMSGKLGSLGRLPCERSQTERVSGSGAAFCHDGFEFKHRPAVTSAIFAEITEPPSLHKGSHFRLPLLGSKRIKSSSPQAHCRASSETPSFQITIDQQIDRGSRSWIPSRWGPVSSSRHALRCWPLVSSSGSRELPRSRDASTQETQGRQL